MKVEDYIKEEGVFEREWQKREDGLYILTKSLLNPLLRD